MFSTIPSLIARSFPGATPPFSPVDIPDLQGWWKGDAGVTTAGGYVTSWTDQVNSIVGTAISSTYYTNSTTLNGYPGITQTTGTYNIGRMNLSSNINSVDFTVFAVILCTTIEVTYVTGGNSGQGIGGTLNPVYGGPGPFVFQNPLVTVGGTNNTTTAQYITWVKSSSSSSVRQNGSSVATGGGDSNSFTFNKIFAGNGDTSSDFTAWEILIYDRVLSNTEISEVETYLSTKYGI